MKKQVVKEWTERAAHDLDAAKNSFHGLEITLYCFIIISNGWELKKTHDIELLLTEAVSFDSELQKYPDFGRKLTAFY